MNFYVISDSENGKQEIDGMYYLVNDQGQYMDAVSAPDFEVAYEKLVTNKCQTYIAKYGNVCYFHKINDTNKSVYELRILSRVFKKRMYDKYGKLMPLPKPEPLVVEKKRRPRRWGWAKRRKKYTPEELAIKKQKKLEYWTWRWKKENWERTHNRIEVNKKEGEDDGIV